jgi:cytochrome P450
MESLVQALVKYPDELSNLQQDIEKQVGSSRLPDFSDIPHLPRVRAVVKEVLRWRPVTAGGLPHMSQRDDTYEIDGKKYFIPGGTNIHPNQWVIHRDESLYPYLEELRPERWLEAGWPTYKEPLKTFPNTQHFSSFGFGRRICPGMHIAERSLYILTARIAWACHMTNKIGKDGRKIEMPEYDYVEGFNVQPCSFEFSLEVRDGKRLAIVREARKDAELNDPLRRSH